MTGTDIVHVPYKGGAPAINDLMAGRVQVMFESLNSIASFARSGAVRALAVSGDHRSTAFPDLPTVAEAGVPGYSAPTWSGVIAPAGVPRPTVDRLNAAINRAIQSQAMRPESILACQRLWIPDLPRSLSSGQPLGPHPLASIRNDGRTFLGTGLNPYCADGERP